MKTLHLELDTDGLKETIESALNLNDNPTFYEQLITISLAKKQVKDLLEEVEKLEADAKGLINAKSKALYGADWQTIVGKGYKITRYFNGTVYTRVEGVKINKRFIKIVESLNTEAIDLELEKTETLPKGLELNNNRTEIIKLTVK